MHILKHFVDTPSKFIFTCICHNHLNNTVALGTDEGPVLIVNACSGEIQLLLRGHTKSVTVVRFCPFEDVLATASSDSTIRFYRKCEYQYACTEHRLDVCDLVWISASEILSCGLDGQVLLIDVSNGNIKKSYNAGNFKGWVKGLDAILFDGDIVGLALLSDGTALNLLSDSTLSLRDTEAFSESPKQTVGTRKPSFSTDGKFVALPFGETGESFFSMLYSVQNGCIDTGTTRVLNGHNSRIVKNSFAPFKINENEHILALLSDDSSISFWIVRDSSETSCFVVCTNLEVQGYVTDFTWSREGVYLSTSDRQVIHMRLFKMKPVILQLNDKSKDKKRIQPSRLMNAIETVLNVQEYFFEVSHGDLRLEFSEGVLKFDCSEDFAAVISSSLVLRVFKRGISSEAIILESDPSLLRLAKWQGNHVALVVTAGVVRIVNNERIILKSVLLSNMFENFRIMNNSLYCDRKIGNTISIVKFDEVLNDYILDS
jgi:membrane-bound inhibitor of C-type lysozyme